MFNRFNLFTRNRIKTVGSGNFTVQSEKEIKVFNLSNSFEFFSFLTEKDSSYVESLYQSAKEANDKSDDWTRIIKNFEYFKFLKVHFKYAGLLKEYDLLSLFNNTRKRHFNEFYKRRPHDEEIEERIKIDDLLIIGSSLSGKTRALIEHLLKIKDKEPDTVIFIPKMLDRADQLSWPQLPEKDHLKYVFFDDIDQYLEKKGTIELISYLVENEFKLLATCKTGPEFDLFHQTIPMNLRENFGEVIKIKREKLSEQEKIGLIENLGIISENTDRYDGNIGSLILPLKQMEKRYADLNRSSDEVDKIARNLLRASKALYYSSNFIAKSTFDKETLTEYCLMLHVGKHANANISADTKYHNQLLKAQRKLDAKSIESFQENLDVAFSKLERDEFNLNFISVNDSSVEVEDAYLEKIVLYSVPQIYRDINLFFDDQQQKNRGYFVKPFRYNQLLERSHVSKVGNVYSDMRKYGIKPNAETFSILAKKSEANYKTCIKWYYAAKKNKLLSVSLFISLLRSNQSNKAILDVFEKLIQDKNLIISYSLEGLNAIVHVLSSKKYQVDLYSILERLIEKGVSISESCLVIGINKSESFSQVKSYLNLSVLGNVTLSVGIFDQAAKRTSSFEEAKEVLELAKQHNVTLSVGILIGIVSKASTLKEAKEVLELAKQHNIPLSEGIFEQAATRTSSFEEAKKVLELAKQHNVTLSVSILIGIVSKASTLKEVKEVLELAKQHNIPLSEGIFEHAATRTSSFEEAKEVLELAKQHNVTLSVGILIQVCYRVTSNQEAKQFFEFIKMAPKFTNYELKSIVHLMFSNLKNWEELKNLVSENRILDEFPKLKSLEYDSILVKNIYRQEIFKGFKKIMINNALQTNFDQNMGDSESAEIIQSLLEDDAGIFFGSIYEKLLKATNKR